MEQEHIQQLQQIRLEVRECTDDLRHHIAENDTHVVSVKDDIRKIKENHLAHIQDSMTSMEKSITLIKTNQEWLMRFFWIVATGSLGAIIAAFFALVLK